MAGLLDEIRRQRTNDKTKLAAASGFSWPTVNKMCTELKDSGYLSEEMSLLAMVGYMLESVLKLNTCVQNTNVVN